jgi:AcrR family transcriptional regulator
MDKNCEMGPGRRSKAAPWNSMPKKSDVSNRIVHAAVALFSRQGYQGTSTREIARLADVSEVTLFRYFEHKEDIFWAALISSFRTIKPRLDLLDKVSHRDAPEVVLPKILSLFGDTATYSPELVRLIGIAFLEVRGKVESVCREHLSPLFSSIADYLAANIKSGRIRNLNPAILTTAIALTIIAQPELSRFFEGHRDSRLDSRRTIDEYTAFWLNVLVPGAEEAPLRAPAPRGITV